MKKGQRIPRERRTRILREMTPEAQRLWRAGRAQALALRKAVVEYVAYVDALMAGKLLRNGTDHLDMARQVFDLYSGFVPRVRGKQGNV